MYSSIPTISITGSNSNADSSGFSATTNCSNTLIPQIVSTSSYASFAEQAVSASYAPGNSAISTSYALTASYALNGGTGGGTTLTTGSTYPVTASWAISSSYYPTQTYQTNTISSSWSSSSLSSSYARSASYAPFTQTYQSNTTSASWASSSLSSSYAILALNVVNGSNSASYALSASYAPSSPSVSASYALSSSYAPFVQVYQSNTTSASYASSSLTASFAVNWDSSSLINYVNSLMGQTVYYLSGTGSGVSNYYTLKQTGSNAGVITLTSASVTNNTYPFSWITPVNEPNRTILPEGIYTTDFTARKTTAPNTTTLTPELYIRNNSGTEYFELPVGQVSTGLTTTFTRYILSITVTSPVTMSATDRLVLKLRADNTGTNTLECQVEGNVLSHFSTPIPAATTTVASVSCSYALTSSFSDRSVWSDNTSTAVYAFSSTSASYAGTSSNFVVSSGSGAWKQYVDFTTGNLVFTYS